MTRSPAAPSESLEGVTVVDPLDGQVRAVAARRHLPACHGDQFRACRAEGRGREARRRFRQESGRHRRLQARRMDARPAPGVRAQPRLLAQGPAASRQDHLRDRPGADRRAAAPAEGRGRRARRRHPAGQVPGGDGRSRAEGARRRGRPAAHRLRHHEHADAALRQREGPPGRQHGDQQGPHRAADQQPRGAGQPAAAAVDAGLRQGLSRATPTTSRRPRRCSPRPAIPTASRPSCSP